MKKKIFSLILAVALVASMMSVAMVSVSASIDSNGRYVPSDPDYTFRYYFYMPKTWENSYTKDTVAGAYWYTGTDAGAAIDGSNPDGPQWPGYIAQYEGSYDEGSVYYVDCPDDVPAIVWNNFVNGGTLVDGEYQYSQEQFEAAKQTIDIAGLDLHFVIPGETCYDGMIYVLDYTKTSVSEVSGKETCAGTWYYYYGNGQYGEQPTLEEAEAAGGVLNTAYQPPVDLEDLPTSDQPTKPAQDTTTAPTTAANADSTKPTAGNPSGNATSSTNDTAKNATTDNGTVQTGDASMAFIILFSVAAAAGVAIFARKKIFG